MKIYRHAVFPITLRVALLFPGISVYAIADSSSCGSSNTTSISGDETEPCNLSSGENLTVIKGASINAPDRTWAETGVGGSYNWNDGNSFIYGQTSVNTSLNNFADSYELSAKIGLRMKW
ncbi:hypothetical protein [Xenorhabdus sp. SGI240]|uniref:hypothetical protein n=1 Tax=Xenorhabdus sp. SGI240 TaxID=3158262 RepID=UPI0032B809CF